MSSPRNLDRITPEDMIFEILSPLPDEMYDGLLIEYEVGIPLLGRQRWLTELKHIKQHHSFVDEQRIGPYKLWYHYHEVQEVENGIQFIDQVNYVMPAGIVGELVRLAYVRDELERIFDFRQRAMLKILEEN